MKQTEQSDNSKRAFRQTALVMDRDRANDQAITFGQFRDMEHGTWVDDGPVRREEKAPIPVRIISTVGGVVIFFAVVHLALTMLRGIGLWGYETSSFWNIPVGIGIFAVGMLIYGGMRGYMAWRDRQHWLRLVRQQEAEKRKSKNESE